MSYLSREKLMSLAETRLQDAQLLLRHGHHSGAYFLSGYAVELALKAEIARTFMKDCLPDKDLVVRAYTHNLKELLGLSGLKPTFDSAAKQAPALQANWSVATQWSEAARYDIVNEFKAVEMISAVGEPNGVLTWLKRYW